MLALTLLLLASSHCSAQSLSETRAGLARTISPAAKRALSAWSSATASSSFMSAASVISFSRFFPVRSSVA